MSMSEQPIQKGPKERVRDVLDLEVFLFGGVPERPDPVYGRDNNDHVLSRTTRAEAIPVLPLSQPPVVIQGQVLIDIDNLEVVELD